MKTWHETIAYIQSEPEYADLVRDAYMDPDISKNIDRFYNSEEYMATKTLIKKYLPSMSGKMLDLGAGNGISSVAFAMDGFEVVALEPDTSEVIGSGAISKMKTEKKLDNLEVISAFAEDVGFEDNSFDIVYARQSMHHANELQNFVGQAYRVLKPGGIFITVRDHVINEGDLDAFLKAHPLHKFYGGENAYQLKEYLGAFESNGFTVLEVLKPYDSVINYAPFTDEQLKANMKRKTLGLSSGMIFKNYLKLLNWKSRNVPGRLYTFVGKK